MALTADGAVEALAAALRSHAVSESVVAAALSAVAALCKETPDAAERFHVAQGTAIIAAALERHEASEAVIVASFASLAACASHVADFRRCAIAQLRMPVYAAV